jgi:hypothetical protein
LAIKRLLLVAPLLFLLLFTFQNCADVFTGGIEFSGTEAFLRSVSCSIFDSQDDSYSSCLEQKSGLLGRLYYLEDRTDGSSRPSNLYTKFGNPIAFNSTVLNSVNVIIDQGIVSETYILMPQVAVPQLSFTEGFRISETQVLRDASGKKLIEAFALDLIGNLQLSSNLSPGTYEIALISDDGSLLDIDLQNNGNYTRIIDNDGYHSAHMKCSTQFVELNRNSKYPIRMRYYQGPRTAIALTMMMRAVDNRFSQAPGATDISCNRTVQGTDFTSDLRSRGWFVPQADAFGFPDVERLAIIGTQLN